MDWDKIFKAVFDQSRALAGTMLTMLIVVVGARLGFFAQLPVEWYYGILIAGILALMTLLSGAIITTWPTVKKRIVRRASARRHVEYSIKNFEALDDEYEMRCLVYIKNRGKQRFKDYSGNDTLQQMVTDCLLDEDDLHDYGGHTHYRVPDHLWERMHANGWGRGVKVDMHRPPWDSRI